MRLISCFFLSIDSTNILYIYIYTHTHIYICHFMSLWVKYVPAVFVSLCVNYPLYISPVFWVWFRLVYSLLPRCILSLSPALSCLALPCLGVLIKYYYLSLRPCLRVLVPPSCVHRDRRPDPTVSGAHSPRFVFRFWKSFVLFLFVCPAARKSPLVIPP